MKLVIALVLATVLEHVVVDVNQHATTNVTILVKEHVIRDIQLIA